MEKLKAFLTLGVFIFAAYMLFFYLPSKKKKALAGVEVVASINDKSSAVRGSGKSVEYEYFVSGEKFISEAVVAYIYESLQPGEQYWAMYEKENPANSILLLNKPYLNPDIRYDETSAIPYSPDVPNSDVIEFKYVVDGYEYTRRQEYGDLEIDDYIGKTYKVSYQVDNPGIGYIHLEE